MINKIIKAIADSINDSFKNIKVYTEEVKQGFERPCFSIICSKIDNNIFRGERYKLDATIEIHYYNNRQRENYNDIMLKLFNIIGCVNVDNFPVRAIEMTAEKGEDYCVFNAGYSMFYYLGEEKEVMGEYMEKLKLNNNS